MTIVINNCGTEIDFDAAVNLMDDDIRETIHNELAPCTEWRGMGVQQSKSRGLSNEVES